VLLCTYYTEQMILASFQSLMMIVSIIIYIVFIMKHIVRAPHTAQNGNRARRLQKVVTMQATAVCIIDFVLTHWVYIPLFHPSQWLLLTLMGPSTAVVLHILHDKYRFHEWFDLGYLRILLMNYLELADIAREVIGDLRVVTTAFAAGAPYYDVAVLLDLWLRSRQASVLQHVHSIQVMTWIRDFDVNSIDQSSREANLCRVVAAGRAAVATVYPFSTFKLDEMLILSFEERLDGLNANRVPNELQLALYPTAVATATAAADADIDQLDLDIAAVQQRLQEIDIRRSCQKCYQRVKAFKMRPCGCMLCVQCRTASAHHCQNCAAAVLASDEMRFTED
jgi:hypothetical protein